MTQKEKLWGIALALILFTLPANCYPETQIWVNVSNNSAPSITSVKTFSYYINDSNNSPSNSFSSPYNRTVYIQIKVHDNNSYNDILLNGYVALKIVLWNGTNQTTFTRFGSSYVNATFESGSGEEAIYTYSFLMDPNDETRLGTENPPKYYRVIAKVSDGIETDESDYTENQSGLFTYQAEVTPGPPPIQVLFDVTITIPENKKIISAGDSFYATVEITKISPTGLDDITITYSILNPNNQTVDYSTETAAINGTIYRIPTLYVPANATSGTYTFQVVVLYLGVGTWTKANFEVTVNQTTTTTTTSTTTTTTRRHGGGGGGVEESRQTTTTQAATTTSTTIPKPSLFFYNAPLDFFVLVNEAKPLMVIIENKGTAPAYGVTVDVGEPMKAVKRVPESADIFPGERKLFIIEVLAPEGTKTGLYESSIKITSPTQLEKEMKFTVLEKPGDERKKIINQIEEITKLKEEILKEAERLSFSTSGEEIFEVFKLLNKTDEKLVFARQQLSTNNYNQSLKEIAEAITYIEDSVFKLSKIREIKNQTEEKPKPQTISIVDVNIPLTIILILLLTLLIFEAIVRKNKHRKLEETYELKRIKDLVFDKLKNSRHTVKAVGESNKGAVNLGERR